MADNLDAYKFKQKTEDGEVGRTIKVGIIGTGWIAGDHAECYKRCPGAEIVALADIVPGKAEAFAKKHGLENVRIYNSDRELIDAEKDNIDAVSVCTYNRQHAPCAIYALDHGVNVLLEKPMCVTLDEAVEICRAEKRSGKIISVGFQPRFDPNMIMLKEVVQSGILGKIYYIQTGGGRRMGIPTPFGTSFIRDDTAGIGALADIGCYSLDMVLNSIGYPKPLTVTGYTSGFFGKKPEYLDRPEYTEEFSVDDFGAGFIRLEGDIILDFRIAWAMNIDSPCDTIILGTEAGVRVPATDCWNGSIGGPLTIYSNITGIPVQTLIPKRDEDDLGNFDKKIRSFVSAVRDGGKAPVPTSQILYNQAIIDGIVRSSKLGREVELDIPEV